MKSSKTNNTTKVIHSNTHNNNTINPNTNIINISNRVMPNINKAKVNIHNNKCMVSSNINRTSMDMEEDNINNITRTKVLTTNKNFHNNNSIILNRAGITNQRDNIKTIRYLKY